MTRGGSHSNPVEFLRSANRMDMLPKDKHWLTGFRVFQADAHDWFLTPPRKTSRNATVRQQQFKLPDADPDAFFVGPNYYVKTPDNESKTSFYDHNHCPAITYCYNDDLLVIWFSTNKEAGRK